jgi:IS30 family transposase
MSDTSATKKAAIVALLEQKMSNRAVAKKENVFPSTVSRIENQQTKWCKPPIQLEIT